MVQHRAIVTMANKWKVHELSNGAIFSEVERPLLSV